MRQAQTLNEAQFRRVLHYCRSRRHPVRDTTIFMVSFYAGLRAKEIASLKLGDVFDETGEPPLVCRRLITSSHATISNALNCA